MLIPVYLFELTSPILADLFVREDTRMFRARLATAVWVLLLMFGCDDDTQTSSTEIDLSVGTPVIADAAIEDAQLVSIDADTSQCDDCVDAAVTPQPSLAVEFLSPSEGTTLPLGATVILTGQVTATNVAPEFVSTRVTIDGLRTPHNS